MVESQPSKLIAWVRFPSPAPLFFYIKGQEKAKDAPVAQPDRATAF